MTHYIRPESYPSTHWLVVEPQSRRKTGRNESEYLWQQSGEQRPELACLRVWSSSGFVAQVSSFSLRSQMECYRWAYIPGRLYCLVEIDVPGWSNCSPQPGKCVAGSF